MSTVFFDIGAALDSRLNTLAGSAPIAWPNRAYTPIQGTLFLQPDNLPGPVRQAGLGNSGYDVHNGVYQVRIYGDAGKGPGEVEAKADAVADHFARGTDLTYNGVDVRLGNVSRNAGIIEDDRYVVAVSINYRVHAVPR